jgi:hypothetical protein
MHEDTHKNEDYVRFIHACMGHPTPTTFLRAVQRGYITAPNQFPRLTSKLVRKHMPSSEATAKGHLNKPPTSQPHIGTQSVDGQRRLYNKSLVTKVTTSEPFDPTRVPKSTTLHLDYTGHLPERCETGTLYFLVACHGSYIHLKPLTNLRGPETAAAITAAVECFRNHGVVLNKIRMDNQSSLEVRAAATTLHLTWELVNPYQKERPNRAERAIRTAKIILLPLVQGSIATALTLIWTNAFSKWSSR